MCSAVGALDAVRAAAGHAEQAFTSCQMGIGVTSLRAFDLWAAVARAIHFPHRRAVLVSATAHHSRPQEKRRVRLAGPALACVSPYQLPWPTVATVAVAPACGLPPWLGLVISWQLGVVHQCSVLTVAQSEKSSILSAQISAVRRAMHNTYMQLPAILQAIISIVILVYQLSQPCSPVPRHLFIVFAVGVRL